MLSKENLRPGDIVRHFKGKLYQIIAIATHTETREEMVVYQALYGDYKVFVRPCEMFLEKVDKNKYPEVTQEYRFVKWKKHIEEECPKIQDTNIHIGAETEQQMISDTLAESKPEPTKETDSNVEKETEKLIEFLDARSCQEKWTILEEMEKYLNNHMLNSIIVSLDLAITDDSFDARLDGVKDYLRTRIRFESNRLR